MKRPPPNCDGDLGPSGSKKRRKISTSEDDESSRPPNAGFGEAPPLHKIYNSKCRKEKPDELFRKDLISAMKLPDSEQLDESEFWDVSDSWKQEWERGVQVPVNSKNVPNPNVRPKREKSKAVLFKLPKKLMRTTEDDFFTQEHHVLTDTAAKAENVCKYDMDDLDFQWLQLFNENRDDLGLPTISEETMERVLEDFETQCSNRFQDALKTEKGLGIEYDEDVICDVCRSPECEEGNEMVFCDSCNICVHQACYGIMAIPEGSWICRPCAANIKPTCILCPNTGGAMKCTNSNGDKWAHVSCALWIPEVSIGCPEKMEPITRISHIPASRWALICSLCRERGACIQCSVKQCKVAYHVTCAFENGLEMEMKTTSLDSIEEGVKMQSFCPKHSKTDVNGEKSSKNTLRKPSPRKTTRRKKDIKNKDSAENEVDEHNARLQKIRSLEAQFHRYVSVKDTSDLHNVDSQVVDFLYCYWVLKRRAKFNKPLLITKCDEANLLIKQHENLLYSRLKMFVHLRQDLERVRNLCYMVSRREKIFRSYMRVRRDVFEKQNEIMTNKSFNLTTQEIEETLEARAGDSLFDRYYRCDREEVEIDNKNTPIKPSNPYAKNYSNNFHTRSRRRTTSQSMMDNINDNLDSESNEMPTLVKCKSEENLSDVLKQEPLNFTHSPFVIKIKPKGDKQSNDNVKQEEQYVNHDQHNRYNLDEPEMPKIIAESLEVRKHSITSDSLNDKNSISLSDKENVNGLNSIKTKKIRNQIDSKDTNLKSDIPDLVTPKLELFDEDTLGTEMNSSDAKKKFRLDRPNSRYQMRSRRCSNDISENFEVILKSSSDPINHSSLSVDASCSPVNSTEMFGASELNHSKNNSPQTPRRGPGRPRKKPVIIEPAESSFAIIKNDLVLNSDGNNLCKDLLELSESEECVGFRMSLRHNREHPIKTPVEGKSKKRSVIVKMDHSDSIPLKETNNDTVDSRGESTQSSPAWDVDDTRPSSLNSPSQPSSARIIIRLRKDPTRESWKNDSSSSSDLPVAFRIVHNELDNNSENAVSEFPSMLKDESHVYDGESRHRYSMRERTVLPRNVKCTMERS